MAWTTPATPTGGTAITVSFYNTNIRDNENFLHDPPGARVYNSGAQTIPHATATALTFDSERYDNDTIHSTVTNSSRLTATTAGKYVISGSIEWGASNGAGIRQILIRRNGTTPIAQHQSDTVAGSHQMTITTIYALSAGDYVELVVYQTDGGNVSIASTANLSPEFSMAWVSG